MKLMLTAFLLILTCGAAIFAQANDDCADAKNKAVRYENQLRDWANLNRYRDANAKLAAPAKNEKRVVFMGDSITDGWNLAQSFPGKPYVNRGIGGQTTTQMLARFRADVIDLKPRAVVILAGTNDIAGNTGPMTTAEITNNLASMCELAKANGIRVVLSSVLSVNDRSKN